jgi:hypothetical protein
MLKHKLLNKKSEIIEKWLHSIFDEYSTDTSRFLKQEKDRFSNPVGYIIRQEAETIFEKLIQGVDPKSLSASLDSIIRIRAVQEFTPSQAVCFLLRLKQVVQDEVTDEIGNSQLNREILDFYERTDSLLLLAFDIYMECRQQIINLQMREVKDQRERAYALLEKANEFYPDEIQE